MNNDPYFDPNISLHVNERGALPHWFQKGKMQSVTIHLCDSMPQCKLAEMEAEKRIWMENHPRPWDAATKKEHYQLFTLRIDKWLDSGYGDCLLRAMPVAKALEAVLLKNHKIRYFMHTYVIMPNHCHFLLTPNGDYTLKLIIDGIIGESTVLINKLVGGSGKIWSEGFDRLIRDDEHEKRVRNYIIRNWSRGGILFDALG